MRKTLGSRRKRDVEGTERGVDKKEGLSLRFVW